jgi:hypothetical protein
MSFLMSHWARDISTIEEACRIAFPDTDLGDLTAAPGIEANPHQKVPGENEIQDTAAGYEYRKRYYQLQHVLHQTERLVWAMRSEFDSLKQSVANTPAAILIEGATI